MSQGHSLAYTGGVRWPAIAEVHARVAPFGRLRRLLPLWVLVSACAGTPLPPATAVVPTTTRALALGYGGLADTPLALGPLLGGDFTLAARFLLQYPYAYAGPILAENGEGRFAMGLGDYRWDKGGFRRDGAAVLYAELGEARIVFAPRTELAANTWRHLALVRRGHTLTAYVDGQREATLTVGSEPHVLGTLRIGRRTSGHPADRTGYAGQHYGLVDDVVALSRALSPEEVAALSAGPPTGHEAGLVLSLTFDEGAPAVARLEGSAAIVRVSAQRNGAADAERIPLPTLEAPLRLPFPAGEAWLVGQGPDARGGTHNGFASFCWDFVLAHDPSRSRGRAVLAAAAGRMVFVEDEARDGGPDANVVMIRDADEEFVSYMHLERHSVAVAFGAPLRPPLLPEVVAGRLVGRVGDTGAGAGNYHLHFAVANRTVFHPEFVTRPVAFDGYEVSTDGGRSWRAVARGIPRAGDWVRSLAASVSVRTPDTDPRGMR